ncbi:tyrosinase cofactor [Streptomyces sp. AC602_WCS936]|uniref:tyrosinase cofactor n=1 Tax=Streptomyces sp. AC602_WCS936 TaxID=2823685 RepID=UPI001C273559|nr:tyrosinase cofactor [Streptomyces sp. AC602_WCS936]
MPQSISRRQAIRAGGTAAAVVALGAVAARPATAGSRAAALAPSGPPRPRTDPAAPFDEIYKGRRIEGAPLAVALSAARSSSPVPPMDCRIDGRSLHLMRRANGEYMSMLTHYMSYPTARACVRAAVDQLGPTAQLAHMAGAGHH